MVKYNPIPSYVASAAKKKANKRVTSAQAKKEAGLNAGIRARSKAANLKHHK